MDANSKLKLVVSRAVFITLIFAISFIVPIFQDYNSRNFPKYEIINCKTYEIKSGDTLSEIAERFKPEHMKLSNYIAEIKFANGIGGDISAGNKLLIPVEKLK